MEKAFERTAHPYYYYESLFSTPEALEEVLSPTSLDAIKHAALLLRDKKAIYLVGNGTSYYDAVAGSYAMNYFTEINSWSRPSYDFYNYPPSQLGKDCAVIGISHSGSTFETVKALKNMKEIGVTTIAITDKDNSDVFNYADAVLFNAVVENQGPKTKSFVASIYWHCSLHRQMERTFPQNWKSIKRHRRSRGRFFKRMKLPLMPMHRNAKRSI